MERERRGERIEVQVKMPQFSLRFTSGDVMDCLREVNKLFTTLKSLQLTPEADFDDPFFFRFMNLSEEIRNSQELIDFLHAVNRVEENFKQKKVALENIKVIDFSNKSYSTRIDSGTLVKKVHQLIKGVKNCRYAVVHVMGSASQEEKNGIVDTIRNRLGNAEIKTLFTDKELLGKTVIEGIFFGDLDTDEMSD